jgi:carboxypeptidase-like protein
MRYALPRACAPFGLSCFIAAWAVAQTPSTNAHAAHLTGRVADAVGGAISNAEIVVSNTAIHVESGRDGRFELTSIPSGPVEVIVRRLGYSPAKIALQLGEDELRDIRVLLSPVAMMMDSVNVTAAPEANTAYGGFEGRKARGFGTFITREQIEHKRPRVLSDLFRNVSGVKIMRDNGSPIIISNRFGDTRACPLRYFLDGTNYPLYDQSIDTMVQVTDIAAIEVYPGGATVPPQFAGRESTCGVIAIWTRQGTKKQ